MGIITGQVIVTGTTDQILEVVRALAIANALLPPALLSLMMSLTAVGDAPAIARLVCAFEDMQFEVWTSR